jgi:transposase InsO family protein
MSGSAGASAPGGATGTGVTAAVVSGSTGDPLNPVYNTQKLAQSLDVLCINGFRWMKDVENVASSKKIKVCLDEEHPDTPGDALAKSLVTEKIPDEWVDAALDKPSAKEAYDWLKGKFTGGKNQKLMSKWAFLLDSGKIEDAQTYMAFVALKYKLARGLRANKHPVDEERLAMGIVSCLQKNAPGFDGNRPRGMPHDVPTNFHGCWFCLEEGHIRLNCQKYKDDCARRAAILAGRGRPQNPVGGMATTYSSDSGELSSQWVIDSGASTHVCNDVRLMHNVHWYPIPKGLNLATGEHVAQRKACGTVCLVDQQGNTCILRDVEFVPTALENLMSVSAGVVDGLNFSTNPLGEVTHVCCQKSSFQVEVTKERGLYFCSVICQSVKLPHVAGIAHKCSEYDLWHARLGHPSSKNMERLQTEDMVKGIETSLSPCNHGHSHCEVCVLGKQTRESYPRSPATATERLEIVHMDIVGELPVPGAEGERYMLTMLDDFSKAGVARALVLKSQVGDAVRAILLYLENQTGHTVKVVRTDRGTEFVNSDLREFFQSKGIRHETSAPYTPQQNGRAERFNRSLKEKVRMLLLQAKAPQSLWTEALPTAVRLLNLRAIKGKTATPYELLFGRKPAVHYLRVFGCLAYIKTPDKDLSAFSPRSEAGMFVGYEPASKAYRVLVGDKIKVSKNVKFFEDKLGIHTLSTDTQLPPDFPRDVNCDQVPSSADEEDWDFVPVDVPEAVDMNREAGRGEDQILPANLEVLQRLNEVLRQQAQAEESGNRDTHGPGVSGEESMGPGDEQEQPGDGENDPGSDSDQDRSSQESDSGDEAQDRVRGGMSRYDLRETLAQPDKYIPGSYFVKDDAIAEATGVTSPNQNGAKEKEVLSSRNVKIPNDWFEARNSPQWVYWKEAMNEEMDSIESHETFEYCHKPSHAKVIPLKWVYAIKTDGFGDVIRFKARLVAQGCKQRPGVDYFETFAPVSTHSSRRVLLNLANAKGWKVHQVDIKTAFLNGSLEEEVYVTQPPCFSNGDSSTVCKLLKSLYGLKQAPRAWHKRLVEELSKFGFTACKSDSSLFVNKESYESHVYLLTYVDDLLIVCKEGETIEQVKSKLTCIFSIHDLGEIKSFLGCEITKDETTGSLKMTNVLKIERLVEEYGLPAQGRDVDTPMAHGFVTSQNPEPPLGAGGEQVGAGTPLPEGHRYLELVGSLQYLATTTRPDIAQAVGVLSRFRGQPTTAHWNGAIRVLRYLNCTKEMGITYTNSGDNELVGYVDADFAGDLDGRKSTTGFVLLLNGSAVSWCSKKQSSVSTSTVEAEFVATAAAVKEVMWMGGMLEELGVTVKTVKLFCDNQGAIQHLKNHIVSKFTKHISISYHYAREKVAWGQIDPVYVATSENVADMFTKPLASAAFEKHRAKLGVS